MFDLASTKVHEEARQGEAYAPFANDPVLYQRRFYIESYGCQMNFSDSEIVASILSAEGYGATRNFEEADLILLNTCSIREKAEPGHLQTGHKPHLVLLRHEPLCLLNRA